MPQIFSGTLKTLQNTQTLASALGTQLRPGDVVLLKGDLGVGKTEFARHLIRACSMEETDVVSPTFTLVQQYPTPQGMIWHFDLYRLENPQEVFELGLEEATSEGICLIEWPERLEPLRLFSNPLQIFLDLSSSPEKREIKIEGPDPWDSRLGNLLKNLFGQKLKRRNFLDN